MGQVFGDKHETGLIKIYFDKVACLSVDEQKGLPVNKAGVESVVKEALEHFAVVVTSNPHDNSMKFRGDLMLQADLDTSTRETFKYAVSVVDLMLNEDSKVNV